MSTQWGSTGNTNSAGSSFCWQREITSSIRQPLPLHQIRQLPESAPLIAVVKVTKAYLALVLGTITEQGEINAKLRSFQTVDRYRAVVHPYGKEALTLFQRLAVLPGVT